MKKALGLGFLGIVIAACGLQGLPGDGGTGPGPGPGPSPGPGPGGGLSQAEFDQAWQAYRAALEKAIQDLGSDPVFSAFNTGPLPLTQDMIAFLQIPRPSSLHPLRVYDLSMQGVRSLSHPNPSSELPRGGTDYTLGEPVPYTPPSPYDFGLKWPHDTQVAELLVDWDQNGQSTRWAHDRDGISHEVPQNTHIQLTLDEGGGAVPPLNAEVVGTADLAAAWYDCNGTPILEPTFLSFTGSLGQIKQLNWDIGYNLTEGTTDTLQAHAELNTTNTNPTALLRLDLALNGVLTRGSDCFISEIEVQSGEFTVTTQAGDESFVFNITVSSIQFDAQGNPVRIDLNGSVDYNGQEAFSFNGFFDQNDFQPNACPGANVTLVFSDGSVSLQEWLQSRGHCGPGGIFG